MTSSDRNQLIADVARDVVAQVAPQELLASSRCVLRQTPNSIQALPAWNVQAFQKAAEAVRQCGIAYQRISMAYMIGSVVLIEAVAVVIYWLVISAVGFAKNPDILFTLDVECSSSYWHNSSSSARLPRVSHLSSKLRSSC